MLNPIQKANQPLRRHLLRLSREMERKAVASEDRWRRGYYQGKSAAYKYAAKATINWNA